VWLTSLSLSFQNFILLTLQETRSIQRLFSSLFNNKNMNFEEKNTFPFTDRALFRQLQSSTLTEDFWLGRLRIIGLSLPQSNKSI
jgi:hypothetical protein